MTSLKLGNDLKMPIHAVTEKLGFIGTTGSGKTYAASRLAELFWAIGAQFIVLDPVGVWYGLRLDSDGKHASSVKIPIFGGLHGDMPLEHTGGAFIANLIVDRAISVILDVSQFESDTQKARFAQDFADRFFFRKKSAPSAVHLFVEECQEFVPQHCQKGEERMLHAFTRLQKLGRNFGIGSSYITQRPQEVHKKALNLAQTLFVFRTTGFHERKAIEAWIQDKGLDQDIAADLPKLPTGTCHVWSPDFLKVSKVVAISKKDTFNASATPEVGTQSQSRELAPIDLERIRSDMAATIEKAKQEDPRALRAELAAIKVDLAKAKATPAKETVTVKEVEVVKDAQIAKLEQLVMRAEKMIERVAAQMEKPILSLRASLDVLKQRLDTLRRPEPTQVFHSRVSAPRHDISRRVRTTPDMASGLSGGERKILTVLAQYPQGRTKSQIAILAGYAVTGGGFLNYLSSLRSKGYLEVFIPDAYMITDSGKDALGPVEPIPTGDALRTFWINNAKLSGGERKILAVLLDAYPESLTKEDIAAQTNYEVTGGGFLNYLSKLRTLELIIGRQEMRASEHFYE